MPLVVKVAPTPRTNEDAAKEQYERKERGTQQWWTIASVILTALVGAAQAILIGFQVKIARKQNAIIETQTGIMNGQLVQTEKAADATVDSVNKMDEIAKGQSADMAASIAEASRAAKAMEALATAMALSAKATIKSVEIARDSFQIGHRAFVSINTIQLSPEAVGPSTLRVQFQNVGRMPAAIVDRAVVVVVNESFPDPASDHDFHWRVHHTVAGPGQFGWLVAEVPELQMLPGDWEDLAAGEMKLLVYGVIRYKTGFAGINGETGFGYAYDPTGTARPESERFSIPEEAAGYNYMK